MTKATLEQEVFKEHALKRFKLSAFWYCLGIVVAVALAAEWTVAEINEEGSVKLAKEEIYESSVKTQIDQRWYVTEIPESENALKKIIDELHKKALTPRKTFEYRKRANSVFIWVYHDKQTAENTRDFGGDWLGMSAKAPTDKNNKVTINSVRLAKQLQPPEVRFGLKEQVRKDIYLEMFNTYRLVLDQAEKEFPNDWVKQNDHYEKLVQNFKDKLMKQHTLNEDQLDLIFSEGTSEGFSSRPMKLPEQDNSVASDEIIDCEGAAATTQFCLDKEEAFELRARIEVLYPSLKELPSPPWNEDEYLAAETIYNDGVQLYRDEYFGDAVAKFDAALKSFTTLETTFKKSASDKRTAISDYLASSDYGTALTELDTLMKWFPEDQELVQLQVEATQGRDLIPLVNDLDVHLSSGNFVAVQEILEQIPTGYHQQTVAQAKKSLEAHRVDTAFNTAMTESFSNVQDENWVLAQQNLATALRIRPNSTVAQELLADVDTNHRLAKIDELTQHLSDMVTAELWEEALTAIEKLKNLEVSDERDYSDLVTELTDYIALEAQLVKYETINLDELDSRMRQDIQDLLDKTAYLNKFARTMPKRQSLVDRFTLYNTPIEVKILSDNATTVSLRPGTEIGSFHSKTLKILPGTYEIIGTRRGYKQVVHNLEVQPNSEAMEVEVECRARF